MKTLIVSDFCGRSGVPDALDEESRTRFESNYRTRTEKLLQRFGGRLLNFGDRQTFVFDDPAQAVGYALAYHDIVAAISKELNLPLRTRASLHCGDLEEPDEESGETRRTNGRDPHAIAERLVNVAFEGQTLLTRPVYEEARRTDSGTIPREAVWVEHGSYEITDLRETVDVIEVGIPGKAPLRSPEDSEDVKKVVQETGSQVAETWHPTGGYEVYGRREWRLERILLETEVLQIWVAVHKKKRLHHLFKFVFDPENVGLLRREVGFYKLLREILGDRTDLCQLQSSHLDAPPFYLETDYPNRGNLIDWLESQDGVRKTSLEHRLELVAQVAEAIGALHSAGVAHCALRPANILLNERRDKTFQIRLTDFSTCRIVRPDTLERRGLDTSRLSDLPGDYYSSHQRRTESRFYLAPELLMGEPPTFQSDLYSLGVLLFQMVVGDLGRGLETGWDVEVEDDRLLREIEACVEISPDKRADSARELARSIRSILGSLGEEEKRTLPSDEPQGAVSDGEEADEETVIASGTETQLRQTLRFGEYQVIREVGKGGFGSVYLAENTLFPGHKFAVKVFGKEGSEDLGELLRDELGNVLGLIHQNIVQVRGFGKEETDGTTKHYMVMDYIEGPKGGSYNLKQHIKALGGKIPPNEVKRIFKQILSAICLVHERMIAHLDLKPQNILLDKNLNAYVSDFGISQAVSSMSLADSTRVSVQALTPAYASPEQIASGTGSRRSDIFSIGVMLLEALTGRRPETVASRKETKVNYEPPSKFGLDPTWDTIIEKCLEPDPGLRYENAAQLLEAIERIEVEEPSKAAAAAPRKASRPFWWRMMLAGLAVSVPVVGVLMLISEPAEPPPPVQPPRISDGGGKRSSQPAVLSGGTSQPVIPDAPTLTPTPIPSAAPSVTEESKNAPAVVPPVTPTWTQPPDSPTPTSTLTDTPTTVSTSTPIPSPTPLPPTASPSFTATMAPPTETPHPTATRTFPPSPTSTSLPSMTQTPLPTMTFTPIPTPTSTPIPTNTATPAPTRTPTPQPPTKTPTSTPSATTSPTATITNTQHPPTATFTPSPTRVPSEKEGEIPVLTEGAGKVLAESVFGAINTRDKTAFLNLFRTRNAEQFWRGGTKVPGTWTVVGLKTSSDPPTVVVTASFRPIGAQPPKVNPSWRWRVDWDPETNRWVVISSTYSR